MISVSLLALPAPIRSIVDEIDWTPLPSTEQVEQEETVETIVLNTAGVRFAFIYF